MIEEENRIGKKITLESLLQAKRYEKPNDEFWESFDEELKQKTLQSIVKKRSYREVFLEFIAEGFKPVLTLSVCAVFTIYLVYYDAGMKSDSVSPELVAINNSELDVNFSEVLVEGQKSFSRDMLSYNDSGIKGYSKVFASRSVGSAANTGVKYVTNSFNNSGLATAMTHNALF